MSQTSAYWPYFTPLERQLLAAHPSDQVNLEIALLRAEIAAVLDMTRSQPSSLPEDSLQILYTIAIASSTIASLVRIQTDYNHGHDQITDIIHQAHHLAFLRTWNYRLMAALGFSVPAEFLQTRPDLLPPPDIIAA
jgi:hypothetical protein